MCTQDDTFDSDFTVRGNLRQTGRYYRPRPDALADRIDALLEQFGLTEYADAKPETLSGGYRRRLMIGSDLLRARSRRHLRGSGVARPRSRSRTG